MCFYLDYDWHADICDVADGPAPAAGHCIECGDAIDAGQHCRSVYQQQHEQCARCEQEELLGDEEPCDEHDYGESFECQICAACAAVLDAIKQIEIAAGCPEHASQPAYGELREALFAEPDLAAKVVALRPDSAAGPMFDTADSP